MQHITNLISDMPKKAIKPFTNGNHNAIAASAIIGIVLLTLPTKSISDNANTTVSSQAYDNVLSSGHLTVASVKGDSTYFSTDGFEHGFGYDLTRAYAQTLGVTIEIKHYDSNDAALKAVQQSKVDLALTTSSIQKTESLNFASINLSCGFDQKLTKNGLHPQTNWSFKHKDDYLAINASDFICDDIQRTATTNLAQFYDQSLLKDDYNRRHFEKTLDTNLPNYKASFQQEADNHDIDWQLLVAMGYQESQLDADAVSPTGVKGLMMLTNNTAKAMGVSDRIDPHQSISGGARYFNEMQEMFLDVPKPDRVWFALASYNMGPYAVKKVQKKLVNEGKDPNSWSNVYTYMAHHAHNNSRYTQCMHYVTSIRSYLESIKTQTT